jgi:hypothetical protein
MSTNVASIAAAIGASGSGKSLWVKQQLAKAKPRRLIVWDPQGEYGDHGEVFTDRSRLLEAVAAAGARGELRAVYRPGDELSRYADRFGWLCQLVYAWGACSFVVEELADVTRPSWAPDHWSVITRKGRHRALRVVAASQRPASVDKDFFGNCTLIHCGRLNYAADVKVMADVLGVPQGDLIGLAPLDWIERDMQTGKTRRGKLAP